MDTEFARTFLAVAAAGNFVAAAQRLHVTQSTVSSRIQTLERQLGARLFRRGRGGAELTAAGQRFLRHAKALVRTLEQARHDVGLPGGYAGTLTLGGRIALWDDFLARWAAWMRERAPEVALRLEIGFEEGMMQALVEGTLDLGVMYTPQQRPGLAIEALFEESLVLVGADPACPWPDPDYIHVDWGPEFYARFSAAFPDLPPPAQHANIGWLAYQWMRARGGSAYLPLRMVRQALVEGRVHRLEVAPVFSVTAYLVYPLGREEPALIQALEGLRELVAQETQGRLADSL